MEVDLEAARVRLIHFCQHMGIIAPAELAEMEAAPWDKTLDFCRTFRISLDWLFCGDFGMLRAFGDEWNNLRLSLEAAPPERQAAVMAFFSKLLRNMEDGMPPSDAACAAIDQFSQR